MNTPPVNWGASTPVNKTPGVTGPRGPFSQVLQVCHGGADEEAAEARAQAPPHAIRKVPPSRPPAPGRARPAPTVDSGKAAVRQLARPPDRSWSRSKSCAAAGAGAGDSAFSTCAEPGSSFCWGPVLQGSTSPSSSRSSTLGQADRARREVRPPAPPFPLARAPATLPAPRTDPAPSRRLARLASTSPPFALVLRRTINVALLPPPRSRAARRGGSSPVTSSLQRGPITPVLSCGLCRRGSQPPSHRCCFGSNYIFQARWRVFAFEGLFGRFVRSHFGAP